METNIPEENNQFLTFKLGDEVFAINIMKVKEVLEFDTITKVPRTPGFMRGVINLRGSVVPVIDLRLKFSMSETQKTVNTCIIIVEVSIEGQSTALGALADAVDEVVGMDSANIEEPPKIGTTLSGDFIAGMGRKDDSFVMILDIDKVFSLEELSLLKVA
ncbi:MAG: chemotaxis protein CheW [Nitrospirae bacterium YQR-1]